MKTIKLVLTFVLLLNTCILFAQTKQTYKVNGTTYVSGQTYKTTGAPKVERSATTKKEFLNSNGYKSTPAGYQVDHIVPLSEGGADQPYNMQLITTEQHKAKTASERSSSTPSPVYTAPTSTYKSTYSTPRSTYNSTYSAPKYNSTPTYNSGSGKTVYTGSKGGQYYYNSKGNKTYVKRK